MARHPAIDRHYIHIAIAIVLGGERKPLAIGAEAGVRFRPVTRREAIRNDRAVLRFADGRGPEVTLTDEDEPIAEQSGLTVVAELGSIGDTQYSKDEEWHAAPKCAFHGRSPFSHRSGYRATLGSCTAI